MVDLLILVVESEDRSKISSFDTRYFKRVKEGKKRGGILFCSFNARCSLNPSSFDSRCTVNYYHFDATEKLHSKVCSLKEKKTLPTEIKEILAF